MTTELAINGIDQSTGGPLDDFPITPEIIAKVARGQSITKEDLIDAKIKISLNDLSFGAGSGVDDDTDLSQAGWGVIFPASLPENSVNAIKDALKPLLNLRKQQATVSDDRFYKEFIGPDNGYKNGESKNDFLKRFDRGPGAADPASGKGVPYYLLIVASPETIPYSFQYQLDVQYAVGRIYFERLEDYAYYANSVVRAETKKFARAKKAAFFGPVTPNDNGATALSAKELIKPLAQKITSQHKDWDVDLITPEKSTKANLANYLGGKDTPALLFTASHGLKFKNGADLQLRHQGALLCQDWPGRDSKVPIDEKVYFSGDDISADADVFGMIAFIFACYGGGTPKIDNFYNKFFDKPKDIAPYSFIAQLPLKLLAHPKGGALGVFAHVDRAWGGSILWDNSVADIETFGDTIKYLLSGIPAGNAAEFFNRRYAEISAMLTQELDDTNETNQDVIKLAGMWTSNNDARNFVFIGDPAVRLNVDGEPNTQPMRDNLGEISSSLD